MAGDRWGIWIDVEGFSVLWSAGDLALKGLGRLTGLVFEIGTRAYPRAPDRLFAHQIGDGFYIASDFPEADLGRCAAIAVVLMRAMTAAGCVARAAIAEGEVADYSGCRPRAVQAAAAREGDSDVVALGEGLMMLQAVMGPGLIRAVTVDKLAGTKGAIVSLPEDLASRLPVGFPTRPLAGAAGIVALDWVHARSPRIAEVLGRAGLPDASPGELHRRLAAYIDRHALTPAWSEPTLRYAGLAP